LSSQIGRKSGRQINASTPIMDARLVTGDRVASTIYPISSRGNTITIRKFAKKPWTITQFLNDKINLFSEEIAAFLGYVYNMNLILLLQEEQHQEKHLC
jgi:Flp pilus assembly CpaF family ATPase